MSQISLTNMTFMLKTKDILQTLILNNYHFLIRQEYQNRTKIY